jgi:D-lactate dehydrogenase
MDVYFYEAFEEEAAALKSLLGNRLAYEMTDKTVQEIGHDDPPARLISIRTQSIIPARWSNRLDGILSRSTGYDHLKRYLESIKRSMPCGYLEEYATRAVAEQAILLMMSLLRRLSQQTAQFKHFNRDGLTGKECSGKKLLVVGVGRIGSEIARIGTGLGMKVRGVDLVQRQSDVDYVEKDEGMPWADAIICAMNLTEENRGYFSYELLKKTHEGAIFINIARGEHSPSAGLLRLVKEGHLGGVGLDVFEDEPEVAVALRSGHAGSHPAAQTIAELSKHPRVLLTPHNAFNTIEAVERKAKFTIDQIDHFRKTGRFDPQL